MSSPTATARFASPIGSITLSADDSHLLKARLAKFGGEPALPGEINHPILAETLAQLTAWFEGKLMLFDLPFAPAGSPESATLRAGIATVPYGETLTYGAVAQQVGSSAQAVGQACKTNAFPIFIPCHRIVSTSGPEFYSAGDGPRTKTWLLDFEYANLPQSRRTRLI